MQRWCVMVVAVAIGGCWSNAHEPTTPIEHRTPVVRRSVIEPALDHDDVDIVQLAFGTVDGVVTDTWSGAAVYRITVELVAKTTHKRRSTHTDANGHYVFTNVEPGDYELAWDLHGALAGPYDLRAIRLDRVAPLWQQQKIVQVGEGAQVHADVTADVYPVDAVFITP